MKLLDFLLANRVPLNVEDYKVHLATWADTDPLQAYHDGTFQEWQEWQTKRNFPADHVLSLIALPKRDRWLFAGIYAMRDPVKQRERLYRYSSTLIIESQPLIGRLIVKHERKGRQPYIYGSRDAFELVEMLEEPLSVADFPGFNKVRVSYAELRTIIAKEASGWSTALSSVKGIYLITDRHTGKQYVGKADGESGLWQRWCTYVSSGHGGNKELRELLGSNPKEYLEHFQFAILEIADFQTSDAEIDARESHWKEILGSRVHGYNAN